MVDRRPSKTVLADVHHLLENSESAAADPAAEMESSDGDGKPASGNRRRRRRTKRHRRSGVASSAVEVEVPSAGVDDSDVVLPKSGGKLGRKVDRKQKGRVVKIGEQISADSGVDSTSKTGSVQMQQRSSTEQDPYVEDPADNRSANAASVWSTDGFKSVDSTHRARKKRKKNELQDAADVAASTAGEHSSGPDHRGKADLDSPVAVTPPPEVGRQIIPSTPSRGELAETIEPSGVASTVIEASTEMEVDSSPKDDRSTDTCPAPDNIPESPVTRELPAECVIQTGSSKDHSTVSPKPGAGPLSSSPPKTGTLSSAVEFSLPVTSSKPVFPAVSTEATPHRTAVRFPPARQASPATDRVKTSPAIAESIHAGPLRDDVPDSPAGGFLKTTETDSPRNLRSSESEIVLTQGRGSQSDDGVADRSANVTDIVAASCLTDCSLSPELPIGGPLPTPRGETTALKQSRITHRRSAQGVRSYALRKRHSSDHASQGPAVFAERTIFMTPPRNPNKESDVYEFHSDDRLKSSHRLRGHQSDGESKGAAAVTYSPITDLSFVYALPPQVTRICSGLESPDILQDGKGSNKQGSPPSRQVRTRSGRRSSVEGHCEEMSDVPKKLVSSRVRRRSSGSESFLEAGSGTPDEPDKLTVGQLRKRSSDAEASSVSGSPVKFMSGQGKLDLKPVGNVVKEGSPVSSRLRSKLCDTMTTDGTDVITTNISELAAGSPRPASQSPGTDPDRSSASPRKPSSQLSRMEPKLSTGSPRKPTSQSSGNDPDLSSESPRTSSYHSCRSALEQSAGSPTKPVFSSSATDPDLSFRTPRKPSGQTPRTEQTDLSEEPASEVKCRQLPKSNPSALGNICRVSDDAAVSPSFRPKSELGSSPQSTPGSSPSQSASRRSQRASFQLLINLRSPKSDMVKRLSSSTSSQDEAGELSFEMRKRSVSPGSPKSSQLSPRSTPPRQQRTSSSQPGSGRRLRTKSSPKDVATSEGGATRRSERLSTKKLDVETSSSQPTVSTGHIAGTSTR